MAADRSDDSPARAAILGGIRRAAGALRDAEAARAAVAQRLAAHPRNLIPARTALPPAALVELFRRQRPGPWPATVERVAAGRRAGRRCPDYLAGPQPCRPGCGWRPTPRSLALAWDSRPALEVDFGPARPDDATSVTSALAGIAETGTLLTASGPGHPTGLTFLPSTHIVVLPVERIVGSYEAGWDLLRAAGDMPRTACLVTGPSRTADIEQTAQLHAHGPGRLHIILVDGAALTHG
ncbi:LutC/YkgG family protein [Rhodospirillum centenum]|uniref:LutC/YkgG family protein n=1 Tax=Rhodospirillum centenum TaxID=34018 RepID=UPI0002F3F6E9|nr:lactate utilization protein [Rhodospirillum centenum]